MKIDIEPKTAPVKRKYANLSGEQPEKIEENNQDFIPVNYSNLLSKIVRREHWLDFFKSNGRFKILSLNI